MFLNTDGAQAQGVRVGEAALPHKCFHHRDAEAIDEMAESLACASPRHAVAGEDDGISRRRNNLRRPLDLLVRRFSWKRLLRYERLETRDCLRLSHILREIKVSGSRLLRLGHLERLANRFRHNLRTDELCVPFYRWPVEGDQIEILMRLLMETLGGHLPGNRHQRRAVHIRIGDA